MLTMLGAAGVPAGTELVLVAAGAFARDPLALALVVAAAAAGETTGGGALYAAGALGRRHPRLHALRERVDGLRVVRALMRFGPWGIFALRLVPGVRGVSSLVPGLIGAPPLPAAFATLLGSTWYAAVFVLLGHAFGAGALRAGVPHDAVGKALLALWLVATAATVLVALVTNRARLLRRRQGRRSP